MRLLHIITGLELGGAETALCRLLEVLDPDQFHHHVVALGSEAPLSLRVTESGARLTHMNLAPTRPNPLVLKTLRRLVRTERPDLVHSWMYHANCAAAVAAVRTKVPMVWGIRQSLYDLGSEKMLTGFLIRIGAHMSQLPKTIVYNSVTSARQHEALGYVASKTKLIPNGFDTQEFRPDRDLRSRIRTELDLPLDAFAVGLIARPHPMKDHNNFLSAAALFAYRCPRAVFVLAGDGVTASHKGLAGRIRELGLMERVRLCGMRKDMAALNAALDVAVSASSWGEAFSNSIGEAMACATPCVATDIGDVRDIIGSSGFVIPPRDPEAMSSAWITLEAMGEQGRRRLGEQARRRIKERYALSVVANKYAELYRELGS